MEAFVFGKKAAETALDEIILSNVKNIIQKAKVYAEGRGFRFDVRSDKYIDTVIILIRIKSEN